MEEFIACFADLDDPRDDNARHTGTRHPPALAGPT